MNVIIEAHRMVQLSHIFAFNFCEPFRLEAFWLLCMCPVVFGCVGLTCSSFARD